jgi:tetratricopeptide (TPR) repeat protein
LRTSLLALSSLALLAAASIAGYKILTLEYRYFQLVQLGDELMADELPYQASRTYTSALAIDREDPLAYVKRAQAERRQGNLAAAVEDLEIASRLSSDELSSDLLLVSLRLGDLYYEVERFDDAAAQYQKVLSMDPEAASVLYKLGLVHFRAGREAEAIDALNRAAASRDGFWETYYLRGAIFRSLGGIDEAAADFRKAMSLRPEAAVARTALIELYLDHGEPDQAIELVHAEINANPGAPRPYLHLARAHRLAERRSEAIEAVSLAIEQDPNLPAAYLALGELWLDEAMLSEDPVAFDKAAAALESVAKMNPADGRAALALGRTYLALNDESRGFAELQRATRATPVPAEAHRLLGDLYRARNDNAEAVTAYLVFLRLRGSNPAVLERLGDTYVDLDKPAMAADVYLELALLEPRRVEPLVKAARSLIDAGDPGAAVRICRQGLATNPKNRALLSLLSLARGS